MMVVIYHSRAILWIGTATAWRNYRWHPDWNAAVGYLLTPFNLGYLGVTIFFVLSGFSIHLRGAQRLARRRPGCPAGTSAVLLAAFGTGLSSIWSGPRVDRLH